MPKRTPSDSSNRIRHYRESMGITQSELAEQTGISLSAIQRYEIASYHGKINKDAQNRIANALDQKVVSVFPVKPTLPISQPGVNGNTMNRRQLIVGTGAVGLGLSLGFGSIASSNRKGLSRDELDTLINDNLAAWLSFNSLQNGTSIDYISAMAYGKLVTLERLAHSLSFENEKKIVLTLLGDANILVARIAREQKNFGEAEKHFNAAMIIGQDTGNPDLKAATREHYINLLLDQEKYQIAARHADTLRQESRHAVTPIRVEAELTASVALAYVRRTSDAYRIQMDAKSMHQTYEPEIWIGRLTNSDGSHKSAELHLKIASQKYLEAATIAEAGIIAITQHDPDDLQFIVRLQSYEASALWELGDIDNAVIIAKESLQRSLTIGSEVNINRVEKLYNKMIESPHARRRTVQELGELVAAQ